MAPPLNFTPQASVSLPHPNPGPISVAPSECTGQGCTSSAPQPHPRAPLCSDALVTSFHETFCSYKRLLGVGTLGGTWEVQASLLWGPTPISQGSSATFFTLPRNLPGEESVGWGSRVWKPTSLSPLPLDMGGSGEWDGGCRARRKAFSFHMPS